MSTPISFTIRPPGAASASAPARPSPLGRHSSSFRGPPSRRMFEQAGDDDDDDEEDGIPQKKTETKRETAFTGFGNGGQEATASKKEAPLVIPSLPNKDWRQSSQARNRPSYVPEKRLKEEASDPGLDRINDGPQRRGLRILSPPREAVQVKVEPGEPVYQAEDVKDTEMEDVKPKVESLHEQALNALLSGSPPPRETEEERLERELVIEMNRGREMDRVGGNLETDAFRQDLANRPEESTLDDYAAVPIAAFGAALLRGMGYDPSKDTAIHIPKARPALLGIGATALSTSLPPEGSASGKKKNARPPKVDYAKRGGRGYMPVIQREKSSTPLSITSGGGGGTTSGEVSRRTSPGTGSETDASARRRRRDLDDVDGTDGSERERGSSRRRDDEYDRDRERRRERREREDRDRDRVRSSRDDRGGSSRDERERSSRDDRDGRRRDDRDYDRRRENGGERYERDRDRDRR